MKPFELRLIADGMEREATGKWNPPLTKQLLEEFKKMEEAAEYLARKKEFLSKRKENKGRFAKKAVPIVLLQDMRYWIYPEPCGSTVVEVTVSDQDILDDYWAIWSDRKISEGATITEADAESCIRDFVALHHAKEVEAVR